MSKSQSGQEAGKCSYGEKVKLDMLKRKIGNVIIRKTCGKVDIKKRKTSVCTLYYR